MFELFSFGGAGGRGVEGPAEGEGGGGGAGETEGAGAVGGGLEAGAVVGGGGEVGEEGAEGVVGGAGAAGGKGFPLAGARLAGIVSSMKERIFGIIQIGKRGDLASIAFDYALAANIALNILVLVLETFEGLSGHARAFRAVEVGTTLFFCGEYALRLWTADLLHRRAHAFAARLRFVFSFDGLVALATILPVFWFRGFVAFRMLRVVRLLHLFRLNARYDSFRVISSVLREKSRQLLSSLFIIFVLMVAGSICMYNAEHAAQPEVFRNAFSGFWWSVSTTLTIGYGDIYPVTPAGTVLAIFLAFLGVGAVAVPTGILSAGFVEKSTRAETAGRRIRDVSAIGGLRVTPDGGLAGKTIDALRRSHGMSVRLVVRDGLSVLPTGDLAVRPGDILIAESDTSFPPVS